MTVEELKSLGGIYFEDISEGFERCTYDKAKMNRGQAKAFFTKLWRKNGPDKSFVDLYYFQLQGAEKKEVDKILNPKELAYLESIRPQKGQEDSQIIFKLDEQLLDIIVKCNEEEVMFSSFYYTNDEDNGTSTWWSNFGNEYVGFWVEMY